MCREKGKEGAGEKKISKVDGKMDNSCVKCIPDESKLFSKSELSGKRRTIDAKIKSRELV